jgi:hypothetical protein
MIQTGQAQEKSRYLSRDYSRIISLDLKSYGTKSLLDGRKINFYSRIRGKHQITEAGNILVTSTQQGRVFEVDMDGNRVLEIINKKLGSDKFNYVISEAIWLPSKTLNFRDNLLCKN